MGGDAKGRWPFNIEMSKYLENVTPTNEQKEAMEEAYKLVTNSLLDGEKPND